MKIKYVIALFLLAVSSAFAGRLTTFAWDWDASWPVGTTIELCGNGDVCASGLTGTQHTLDLPIVQGQVISGRARAIPPAGYLCGDPPVLCQPSEWGTVARTWPALPSGFEATRTGGNPAVAASIVSGSVAKATNSNSRSIAISNYTINAGTDLALVVIWCGNYPVNGDEVLVTWNPGSSVSVPVVIRDANSSHGSCAAFLLKNPTTGTGTVTANAAGGTASEDNVLYVFQVSNVNQTTPTADAAGGVTVAGAASVTLTTPNMTANDLAIGAISYDNSPSTVTITTGNNIGTDSTDYAPEWTDAGAAYNTGTGSVNIVFSMAAGSYVAGTIRFRIVGTGAAAAASALPPVNPPYAHLLVR